MNASHLKRLLSLLTALALTVAMCACSGSGGSGSTAQPTAKPADTQKETPAAAAEPEPAASAEAPAETKAAEPEPAAETKAAEPEATNIQAEDGPFARYEPGITLTSVKQYTTAYQFPSGDDIDDNVWTREIKDALNIDMKYIWTTSDPTQYSSKLNISIASGELPDFFSCGSATFVNLAQSGLIMDITDVYEKYVSPESRNLMDIFPEGFDSGKYNGRLMGLSEQGYGLMSNVSVMWIREDWLKGSGQQAPKTMDELTVLAQTFMAEHPGSYGIALNNAFFDGLQDIIGISNGFHAFPRLWVRDSSNQIVYGSTTPEMKRTLLFLRDLFQTGVIDQEFGVKDTDKVNEDILNGKVGICFGQNWLGYWPFLDVTKQDENATFIAHPIPSSDGQPVQLGSTWPVGTYFVVNKDCANPEAVIKLVNLKTQKTYFGTADEYETLINHEAENIGPIKITDSNGDYNKHDNIMKAIETRDPSPLKVDETAAYEMIVDWIDNKNPDGYGVWAQTSKDGSYEVIRQYFDNNRLLLTELRGASPDSYAEKQSTLEKLEVDAFSKVIMGGSEDDFDTFVANWYQLGGDEATKEINDIYNK
jgi:putative aldouronate transport system substrate-binding protein